MKEFFEWLVMIVGFAASLVTLAEWGAKNYKKLAKKKKPSKKGKRKRRK